MSNLATVLGALPALLAAAVAAIMPREAKLKHRLGFGLVAFVLVAAIRWLWPDGDVAAAVPSGEQWPYLLDLLIALPLGGAAALLFMPRQMLSLIRGFTYLVFAVGFVASLWLLSTPMTPGWHYQHVAPWIESAGIRWHVAVDGLSVWMVILTTFTTPIAVFASFGSVRGRIKELCIAFLVLQGAMIGSFVAIDLFVFYLFWELMLVPMFLLIGIWGGANKIKAAVKFFLFTMTGSVLMLAAMLYLVWSNHALTGQWTFDYLQLSQVLLPGDPAQWGAQTACFWAFSLAFFIKVPMFPFHTWLPDAHTEAPTGGSVVLAAVMLKLGTYAYLRFSMGLFPGPAFSFAPTLASVAIVGGIIYGALCAWKQNDVKRLVAYSSVAHLGFVMLGLFGGTVGGMQGAILQMVNHGIATGALFLLVGVIYDRRHTRELKAFGGLAKVMPVYAALFVIVTLASIGVPGTNGFIGEFMIIAGTFVSEQLRTFASLQAVGAALGVILAAIYMLSVVRKMFFGPLDKPENKKLNDITAREALALAPLIICIFVLGLFPALLLDRTAPAVEALAGQFRRASEHAEAHKNVGAAQKLPASVFFDGFLKEGGTPADGATHQAVAQADAAAGAATAPAGRRLPAGARAGRRARSAGVDAAGRALPAGARRAPAQRGGAR